MVRSRNYIWILALVGSAVIFTAPRLQAQHMHGNVVMGAPTASYEGAPQGCPDGSCGSGGCSSGCGIGCPVPFVNIRPWAYSKHCPPPFQHCQEGPPCIKVRTGCPKPVCDPCKYEHYGYYQTCWRRWPFPPDWSHCPCPPPSAELDFPAPPLAANMPVPISPELLPEPRNGRTNSQNSFHRVPVSRVPNNYQRISYR